MESEKLIFKADSNNHQISALFLDLHDREIRFTKKEANRVIYFVDFSAGLENTINELAKLLPQAATDNFSLVIVLMFFTTVNQEKVDYFSKLVDQQNDLVKRQTQVVITKDIYYNFTLSSGLPFDKYIRQVLDNSSIHISRSGGTIYHPLYIEDFIAGLKKAILSRTKTNPTYLLSGPVSELELTYKLNSMFDGSIDIYNSLEETYQNNISTQINTSQLQYNWFPDTEIDQILKSANRSSLDTSSDIKFKENEVKDHLYQKIVSKIPKIRLSKLKKPNWVKFVVLPLVVLLATYLIEIGAYLYLVQSSTTKINQIFSQPFETISLDNEQAITKVQLILEIAHFLHPTVLPIINLIDPAAKQYVDDYYTLISYLKSYNSSLNTQNSLVMSLAGSLFDYQSELNTKDILQALISETNSQYQLLSQSSLILDSINRYSSGQLDNLKSSISTATLLVGKQLDYQEILLQLSSSDSEIAIALHDNKRQNPYSGDILAVLTSQITDGRLGKINLHTAAEIDARMSGKLESPSIYKAITGQDYQPLSDFLYTPGPETSELILSYVKSAFSDSTISNLVIAPITLFDGLDYQGQLEPAIEAYREQNSSPLHNYFEDLSQKIISSTDVQNKIIGNLYNHVINHSIIFSSSSLEINRLASVSELHLDEPFLPCHPSLPTGCHNSHIGIYHTLFGQDQRPESVSYNQNMKITTNQSYHSFNLTLDINRLESSGSSELVDLVTFSLPLDHVLESVTFNSMSHDLADINYKINGKLKQFQIPVKLLPQNNTLNLIYKQPQSLNLSSYSFHISSNTQKTRSDQTLNVLYEYPNSLAISGFTRQVEVIPGGLIFEMNSKQPGFGVIFKEP